VAAVVFLAALAVYTATMAPTVTLEYSGQLIVAADHMGVARPLGYPVWTLLAKVFSTLFSFVDFHGYRNPAWGVHLMSAVFGALACSTMSILISRIGRTFLRDNDHAADASFPRIAVAVSSVSASLMFALSPTMGSQSVIAETHTLTNFALLAFLSILLHWMTVGPDHRALEAAIAFLVGFNGAISPLLFLMIPPVLLAAAFVSRRTFLRFLAATLAFLLTVLAEAKIGYRSPATAALVLGIALSCLAVGLRFRRTRGAAVLWALMFAGLLPFLYLPLAASGNPPMNMGRACTWEGLLHVLSRSQYERFTPLNPFTDFELVPGKCAWMTDLIARQFPWPLLLVGGVPLAALPWLPRTHRRPVWLLLLGLLLFGPGVLVILNTATDLQSTWIARTIYIPVFALCAVLIGCGLSLLLGALGGLGPFRLRKADGSRSVAGRRGAR
jgi:hypothetical protein